MAQNTLNPEAVDVMNGPAAPHSVTANGSAASGIIAATAASSIPAPAQPETHAAPGASTTAPRFQTMSRSPGEDRPVSPEDMPSKMQTTGLNLHYGPKHALK